MRTIAIVGGGISGLALGEALQHRARTSGQPIRTVIFEEGPAIGGKISTIVEDGFVIETGPHGFLDRDPLIHEVIARLGLTARVRKANEAASNRYIVRGGKLRQLPASPPAFLASDVLPLLAKLRVLLEPFIGRNRSGQDESVWSFAARRLGPAAADVLVDAMVTGIYGGDPKRLSVAAAFPALAALEQQYGSLIRGQIAKSKEQKRLGAGGGEGAAMGGPRGSLHSFDKGLGVLIHALAEKLEVRTQAPVRGLARDGARWKVTADGAEPLEADAVVLTVPTFEMLRLLRPLAGTAADPLDGVMYPPVAVVVQAFDRAAMPRTYDGFGFLAPNIEGRGVLGSIWASTVFPDHAPSDTVMMRTLLGGVRHPERAEADPETLLERSTLELRGLLGLADRPQVRAKRVIRWERAIPQYDLGHSARIAAADGLEQAYPGLYLSGNGLRGVAMVQCVTASDALASRIFASEPHN
ncbi:MAG: protoporphyrinogen oxidase [Myxococcota bacterium]